MRIVFSLSIALLLGACATSTPASAPASNAQLVRSLYESFGRGDVKAILAALDPEVVWIAAEGNPYGGPEPFRGPQAVASGVFQRIGTEWNNFGVQPQEVIDGGEMVVVLGRYTGTFKSTGRPLDAQFAHVWTIRNGKVVKMQQYIDTAQFQRVMAR